MAKPLRRNKVAFAESRPFGRTSVAEELVRKGIQVSAGGVRRVWSRHKLLTGHERLLPQEEHVARHRIEFTDEQIRPLEGFSPEFRERHIATRHTGELIAVGTFFAGHLNGVGKVYLQSGIDCHSQLTPGGGSTPPSCQ